MLKVWIFRKVIRVMAWLNWRKQKPQDLDIRDTVMQSGGETLGLRVYTPKSANGQRRGILYFHGGGFVIGDLDTQDATCRQLCVSCDAVVVSVDYRLAPEHPFPAAAEDAIAALRWLLESTDELGIDAARIHVAGDSAGGNLAAVVAQQARSFAPGSVCGQILIYPVTHHFAYGTESYETRGKDNMLTSDMMEWFWNHYLEGQTLPEEGPFTHELATPLAVKDLTNLPPAIVIVAGLDPLRDESIAYGEAMQTQGVAVKIIEYADQEHGFVGTGGPGESNDAAIAEIAAWMGTAEG